VLYHSLTLIPYFDPLNTPKAFRDPSTWNLKVANSPYWTLSDVNSGYVVTASLGRYFELLSEKTEYIATDFNMYPLWYIFNPIVTRNAIFKYFPFNAL
jgi:hypothetical protein